MAEYSRILRFIIYSYVFVCVCLDVSVNSKIVEVFKWKQIGFDFDGIKYSNSSASERKPNGIYFNQELEDAEKFFIQYNNVPIGMEIYRDRIFVTVPRRRHGIPSTLNYVEIAKNSSPLLKPYPNIATSRSLVSVYRPRVDVCGRLWVVDTGLLEVPGERKQIQKPAIIVFDLKTNEQILRYELKDSDLINERSTGGLTSITVDVTRHSCDDAFAYINDLATEGLIVFSMREKDSWRISDPGFAHDESALNFTVAGHVINWKDGLFSIALSSPDKDGKRTAYFHPLASTQEFSLDTQYLKNKGNTVNGMVTTLGTRGKNSQSGSHAFHPSTNTLLFANVAQDAILCWHTDSPLTPENVAIAVQDHAKLVYISDLKVVGDNVWVLVNQIPRFVFSTLDTKEFNYFIHRMNIQDLIRGTVCDKKKG